MVQPISNIPEVQRSAEVKPTCPRKVAERGDTLSISFEAKSALQREKDIALAWEVINGTPDVRQEMVDLARKRLNSGFYNQPDIIEAYAKKMMENINL